MLPDIELLQSRYGYFIYVRYFIIVICMFTLIALIQHDVTCFFETRYFCVAKVCLYS